MDKHVEDENSLDRISLLPDDVLSHVLSFLPTRDAVRTSILSKSWRYLYTMTTCLSFDDTPYFDDSDSDADDDNKIIEATQLFKKFVDKVLELHPPTAIKKFRLVCKGYYVTSGFFGYYGISDLNRWVRSGFQESVQELHLECIKFFDLSSMEQLFSCCGMLENLTLIYCSCDAKGHAIYRTQKLKMLKVESCCFEWGIFEIDAPNLAYLNWESNVGLRVVPSWETSGSFVKAELTFDCHYQDLDYIRGSHLYDRHFLNAAASKTTRLCLMQASVQSLRMLDDQEEMQIPEFHCLSRLELGYWDYNSWEYLTSLLRRCPQLKTVIFHTGFCIGCACTYNPVCLDCDSLSDLPLIPISCHAEQIEVHNFCGHKGSLSVMGYLLRNASVLKRLIVFTLCENDSEELKKIRNELSMLPRASIDCCLEINESEVVQHVDNDLLNIMQSRGNEGLTQEEDGEDNGRSVGKKLAPTPKAEANARGPASNAAEEDGSNLDESDDSV